MSGPKRIELNLFDPALQELINAAMKVYPTSYAEISANSNPEGHPYAKVLTVGTHKNEIYAWDFVLQQWELIGADDKQVAWGEVMNKPTVFPSEVHSHVKTEITDFAHAHSLADVTGLETALSGKAPTEHTHNKTAITDFTHAHSLAEVTGLTTALAGKAEATHDHDGRYNLKSEITNFLANKADAGHNHNTAYAVKSTEDVVNDHESRLDAIESGYSEGHIHDNLSVLDKLTYSGASASLDLKLVEDLNTTVSGLQLQAAGSAVVGALKYNGTTRLTGTVYGGTTSPSGSTRLNYDGYLYATRFYQGSTQVATLTGIETLTNKTFNSAKINTCLCDVNGNELIRSGYVASAVNDITVVNAITGNSPKIIASGSDVNVNLLLEGQGAGKVYINGSIPSAEGHTHTEFASKVDNTTFTGHTDNSTVHVLQTDKNLWNAGAVVVSPTQPASGFWIKITS